MIYSLCEANNDHKCNGRWSNWLDSKEEKAKKKTPKKWVKHNKIHKRVSSNVSLDFRILKFYTIFSSLWQNDKKNHLTLISIPCENTVFRFFFSCVEIKKINVFHWFILRLKSFSWKFSIILDMHTHYAIDTQLFHHEKKATFIWNKEKEQKRSECTVLKTRIFFFFEQISCALVVYSP